MDEPSVNILIARSVRPGRESAFEETVRAWIPTSLTFPGHHGVVMLRPGPGSREYATLLRFRTEAEWEAFRAWQPYKDFLESLRPLLTDEPDVDRLHGLEAWFTARGGHGPARWKMALVTWVGVNIAVYAMSRGVGLFAGDWAFLPRFLLVNALVVAALTWAVMPALTRVARPWLTGGGR